MSETTAASTSRKTAGAAGSAVRRAFAAVAAVRRAPAVHPRGLAFTAELESVDPFPVGRYDAVVRLTRGLGLTDTHADVLGLAIRWWPFGEDHPCDLLLSTAGETGGWLTAGKLTLVAPGGDTGERFDPILNHPPGWSLKPDWLATLRELAYTGSRRGRHSVGATNQHQY